MHQTSASDNSDILAVWRLPLRQPLRISTHSIVIVLIMRNRDLENGCMSEAVKKVVKTAQFCSYLIFHPLPPVSNPHNFRWSHSHITSGQSIHMRRL